MERELARKIESKEGEPVCTIEKAPGIKTPMMVCVESHVATGGADKIWKIIEESGYTPDQVTNARYFAAPSGLRAQGMKVTSALFEAGEKGRAKIRRAVGITTALDEHPKQSGIGKEDEKYYWCLGFVASGATPDGARISV
jgi:hypothetical protein